MWYTYSDFAGDSGKGKIPYEYELMTYRDAVVWSFKKMPIVTLSTTEPKYVDAPTCACQSVKKLITNKKNSN